MHHELPSVGAAPPELRREAEAIWSAAAAKHGIDLTGYDTDAPFESRVAWAAARGLGLATVLTRYSTDTQSSTADQLRARLEYAAANQLLVPGELLCIDEGLTGRSNRRPGLLRLRAILVAKLAGTMIVFRLSRLFRSSHRSQCFVLEEVVEPGLRAISVAENIDTSRGKGWKVLATIQSMADEMQVDACSDHVRIALEGVFRDGR